MQFFGTYTHKIDAKGRVALPAKFRKTYEKAEIAGDGSAKDLVITCAPSKNKQGQHECLYVFSIKDFDLWIKSFFDVVGGYNPRNKEHEMQMWALHANVEDVSIDSAGRINIPTKFRDKAALGSEVALVGTSGRFEIWDAKRMEEKLESIDLESLLYD